MTLFIDRREQEKKRLAEQERQAERQRQLEAEREEQRRKALEVHNTYNITIAAVSVLHDGCDH